MTHILTLNAGSSSLKLAVFDPVDDAIDQDPVLILRGQVDRIGGAATLSLFTADGTPVQEETPVAGPQPIGHQQALQDALSAIQRHLPQSEITQVGHRIVHGGLRADTALTLTSEVLEDLATLAPFAPLHQPHNLAGVRAAMSAFPNATQTGCFDTAFHRNHPFVNDTFAIPRRYYEKGVRRYGFHGLSYNYIESRLKSHFPDLHSGRVVVAHLGNGASMCSLNAGASVASTMGFSALDGLPMGTRSGQVDPGVLLYLMDQEGLSAAQITQMLYKDSGLLGLSGISNDMHTPQASEAPQAKEAIDYFTFRARRELGALAATLEGLDAVVFCGGIGENSALIRQRICQGMDWIGLALDPAANARNDTTISTQDSAVKALVIPTDEELVIARACARSHSSCAN